MRAVVGVVQEALLPVLGGRAAAVLLAEPRTIASHNSVDLGELIALHQEKLIEDAGGLYGRTDGRHRSVDEVG